MPRRSAAVILVIAAGGMALLSSMTGARALQNVPAATAPAAPTAVGGRVTFTTCGAGPVSSAKVVLDAALSTRTDIDGQYRFTAVLPAPVPGLPAEDHVLVVMAPNTRTKIVRFTPSSCRSPCVLDFTVERVSAPGCARPARVSLDAADTAAGLVVDRDYDGIDDFVEDWIANRFAPVVYHGRAETNYPVSVDWLLKRTSLREVDSAVSPRDSREVAPAADTQKALLGRTFSASDGQLRSSDGTRSVCKQSGYFLADVEPRHRAGQLDDPHGWITYVHSYGNVEGGITIQYWRVYAYDQSKVLFLDFGHGGDWEGIAVHLDSSLQPSIVGLLGHLGIDRQSAREISWEGTHPRIVSEEGGHASRKAASALTSRTFTRQDTWTGGAVVWWDGRLDRSGGVLNVGEKSRPRNGQAFIQYSGLWGAPHRLFATSGYWGPAFNETDAVCDDGRSAYRFSAGCGARSNCTRIAHTAWCAGMDGGLLDLDRECYAARLTP